MDIVRFDITPACLAKYHCGLFIVRKVTVVLNSIKLKPQIIKFRGVFSSITIIALIVDDITSEVKVEKMRAPMPSIESIARASCYYAKTVFANMKQ